jgi:hypothetical protein
MGSKEQQRWKAAKSKVAPAMNADALVGICRGSRHQNHWNQHQKHLLLKLLLVPA